jgi:hypothetical protein
MRDTRTCKLTRKIPTMSAATSLTGVATGAEVHAYVPRAGYPDLIPAELSGRVVRRQIGAYAVPEYQPDPLDLPGAARTLDTFRNWRSRITWARSLGPGGHVHAFAEASKTLLGHDRLAQQLHDVDPGRIVPAEMVAELAEQVETLRQAMLEAENGFGLLDPGRRSLVRTCAPLGGTVLVRDAHRFASIEGGQLILETDVRQAVIEGTVTGNQWTGTDADGGQVLLSEQNARLVSALTIGGLRFRVTSVPLTSVYAHELVALAEGCQESLARNEPLLLCAADI